MLKIALLPQIDEARQKMSNSLKSQFLDSVQEKKYETLRLIKERPLKAPTLIVWGLIDPSAPLSLGIALFQLIGSVVDRTQLHVFNHAGHYVFREHPQELHRLIVDFVNNLWRHICGR